MFHDITPKILSRMSYLEELDARDRTDGTSRLQRLKQVPPETGQFLALMARLAPTGQLIEIGTSAAYSTLWISLAAKERGQKITTFEILIEKYNLALETVKATETQEWIELKYGNAKEFLPKLHDVAFCFLDAEKADYKEFYTIVVPLMVQSGILVIDNVISHYEEVKPVLDFALQDPRIDAVVVPIGRGLLLGRVH